MKTYSTRFFLQLLTLTVASALTACDKNEEEHSKPESESTYARLLITDKTSNVVTLLDPARKEQSTFQATHGGSAVYTSATGRWATVVSATNNLVEFFDTGIDRHDDHVHVKGSPKWGLTKSTGPTPSHVYGSHNRISIFNDGNASISHVEEGQLHTVAAPGTFVTGAAHHGAMILFDNGSYAVTHKNNTVSGSLPEQVKLVNTQGAVVSAPTVATQGIHGDAGDGQQALFGSSSGVLVVKQTGEQRLIPYPASAGSNWLSTIYYAKKARTFLGSRNNYGVFRIDPTANTITQIGSATKLVRVALDEEGANVLVLDEDGLLSVFDAATGALRISRSLTGLLDAKIATPYLVASRRYVYLTNALQGKVHMLRKDNLADHETFPVAGAPLRLAFVGADVDSEDGH
ncbi:YncE family protein [Hymenobacter psychrotolerans]|uniref:DNA-binding beta-propeller fold protein YncE n=1 Tax=Hymenobacter psychrotolerans DSM 18569 TaxID=1121959 RepID=A0A1M6PBS0_9BACT|nr:hypothetical protein [Hymenobacter psychrotolerans]SHK05320.1 hypothetical protein SAMN02746009_00185 [Hymenobacter psychrotolerans DSM 18569]